MSEPVAVVFPIPLRRKATLVFDVKEPSLIEFQVRSADGAWARVAEGLVRYTAPGRVEMACTFMEGDDELRLVLHEGALAGSRLTFTPTGTVKTFARNAEGLITRVIETRR